MKYLSGNALGADVYSLLRRSLELAALGDGDGEFGLAVGAHWHTLHLAQQQQRRRVQHLAEDHVLAVQPVARRTREEELAAVRPWPAVRLQQQQQKIG